MGLLAAGFRKFHAEVFPEYQGRFEDLEGGQHPLALMITCSDSRIDPHLLTQTKPGQVFLLRNAGNLVPPYAVGAASGEAATIEYAIKVLQVNQVVILGHECCGALQALLDPASTTELPAVRAWLAYAADARERLEQTHPGQSTSTEERLRVLAETNVDMQLKHLRTHPTVAAAVESGTLLLRGWVYDFVHGMVRERNPKNGRFEPLVKLAQDAGDDAVPTPVVIEDPANE